MEKHININFPLGCRRKNKCFKRYDYEGALNYCLQLDDGYISTCAREISDWAKEHDHPILRKKCWMFC